MKTLHLFCINIVMIIGFACFQYWHLTEAQGDQPTSNDSEKTLIKEVTKPSKYGTHKFNADLLLSTGTSNKVIKLRDGDWMVSEKVAIPHDVVVVMSAHSRFCFNNGGSLKFNGLLKANNKKIFELSAPVIFSNPKQEIVPEWWGALPDGTTDSTAPMQKAINSIDAYGPTILLDDGQYMVGGVGLKSNITVKPLKGNPVIKQKLGSSFCFTTNPAQSGLTKDLNYSIKPENIILSGITFRGSVDVDGFSEFVHLLQIKAVNNITIDSCKFIGFRGDGIYIGETSVNGQQAHNKNINISKCFFDGINRDNRNGISVIDGERIKIENCTFIRCTRQNMPGAIDLEPNNTFNIIKSIEILNNTFNEIGGSYIIAVEILKTLNTPIQNITIAGNTINGDYSSSGIYVGQTYYNTDGTPDHNVIIADNKVYKTKTAFMVRGVKQLKMYNNLFDESRLVSYLSYGDKKINIMDAQLINNTFSRLSQEDGNGIMIFGAINLEIKNNIFDNIGKKDGSVGLAINIKNSGGAIINSSIHNNQFKGTNTKIAINIEKRFPAKSPMIDIYNNHIEQTDSKRPMTMN